MARTAKITTGPNDRPRDETIAQSGGGLPDDSSAAVDVNQNRIARIREKLQGRTPAARPAERANSDAVPPGTPGSGENICRRCSGTGTIGGQVCPECNGSGKVVTPVGGGG
jgi:hypothetical protein